MWQPVVLLSMLIGKWTTRTSYFACTGAVLFYLEDVQSCIQIQNEANVQAIEACRSCGNKLLTGAIDRNPLNYSYCICSRCGLKHSTRWSLYDQVFHLRKGMPIKSRPVSVTCFFSTKTWNVPFISVHAIRLAVNVRATLCQAAITTELEGRT